MTTFEQVKAMIDEYHSRGIKRLEITIDGWTKNGVYGKRPKHFPAASQLGGYKGLEELAAYAQERGVKLYLKANYVRPFEDTGSYKAKRDAVYGIKKEAQASYNYYISSRFNNFSELFHLLKPKRVFDHHIAKELNQYVKLGISGVHLQYMGDTLYSDQDPRNWTTREETKRNRCKCLTCSARRSAARRWITAMLTCWGMLTASIRFRWITVTLPILTKRCPSIRLSCTAIFLTRPLRPTSKMIRG